MSASRLRLKLNYEERCNFTYKRKHNTRSTWECDDTQIEKHFTDSSINILGLQKKLLSLVFSF